MTDNLFSIIHYFDPFGDGKSNRKVLSRKNYRSALSLSEIEKIVAKYNQGKYYNAISIANFDRRSKNNIENFDTSYFNTSDYENQTKTNK